MFCYYILTCIVRVSRIVGFHLGILSALLNSSCSNRYAGNLIVPCNQRTNIFNERKALTFSHSVKIHNNQLSVPFTILSNFHIHFKNSICSKILVVCVHINQFPHYLCKPFLYINTSSTCVNYTFIVFLCHTVPLEV